MDRSPAVFVLAAGAIALANDALFAPLAEHKPAFTGVNWRIVPATAVLAIALSGLNALAPGFGRGLSILVLLSVLVIPFGNAPTPLETMATALGYARKVS